jgi:hypothetical protein
MLGLDCPISPGIHACSETSSTPSTFIHNTAMMPPEKRIVLHRMLLQRLLLPRRGQRTLANWTKLASNARPQLPFLTIPIAARSTVRYFTTEKKRWLKFELVMFFRYMITAWGIIISVGIMVWAVKQELLEHAYPTPPEWSFMSRMYLRGAKSEPLRQDTQRTDWVEVMDTLLLVIKRLEDPNLDGAGLKEVLDEPTYVDGVGKAGYDVSSKSENWKRGYYEALMLLGQAAEQLDGWVIDETRRIVFPPDVVIGPSNPYPKPIPVGAHSAPLEKNCKVAYEPAENHYLRILMTKGFTARQKMNAALSYASFLDFKSLPDVAEQMYEWALAIATEDSVPSPLPYNSKTHILNDTSNPPSMNLLDALTAIATHKARAGDITAALPILVSILKARRLLPNSGAPRPGSIPENQETWHLSWTDRVKKFVSPPPYPAPPDDGTQPPWRDVKELCEEAGLSLYIGEILYATQRAAATKEEGLLWTREAVDMAEEQLRLLGQQTEDKAAQNTCRECLAAGIDNWTRMVSRLAKDEKDGQQNGSKKGSTFGFWSGSKPADTDRWAAEERVVEERRRRTKELLENLTPPSTGFLSFLKA